MAARKSQSHQPKQSSVSATGQRVVNPQRLRWVALTILLMILAGRTFLSEQQFRTLPIKTEALAVAMADQSATHIAADLSELARAIFAVAILIPAALALWANRIESHGRWCVRLWPIGVAVFCVASLLSIWGAADARSAWLVWAEQAALLIAAVTTAALCRQRNGFLLVVIVLAGLGGAVAVKGIYQCTVEIPDQIEFFHENQQAELARAGITPDSPQATMYEARLSQRTPKGFLPLANVFGSQLLLLLAATGGLLVVKWTLARRATFSNKADSAKPPRKPVKGKTSQRRSVSASQIEIPVPYVAFAVTAGMFAAIVAVLLLTRSRGAIVGAIFVAALVVGLWRWRDSLAKHWKRWAIGSAAVMLLSFGGLICYGVAKDRLPTKTLSFRWMYWQGSGKIIADHLWLGVGGGNFPASYLQVRRPAGEESVKTPHNVIAHALTQYGLPVGGLYLVLLAGGLVLAWRPGRAKLAMGEASTPNHSPPMGRVFRRTLPLIVTAAIVARWYFSYRTSPDILLLFELILPGVALLGCLLVASWSGGKWDALTGRQIRGLRIALAAGATAFVLHNFVTFSLWTPGIATAFWIALGACIGVGRVDHVDEQAAEEQTGDESFAPSWTCLLTTAGLGMVLLGGAVAIQHNVWPIYRKSQATLAMIAAAGRGNVSAVQAAARQAMVVDSYDALPAMQASQCDLLGVVPKSVHYKSAILLALSPAEQAIQRSRDDSVAWHWRGELHTALALDAGDRPHFTPAAKCYRQAIRLDPANARLRLEWATHLARAVSQGLTRPEDVLGQLHQAERINQELQDFNPHSTLLLQPNEHKAIQILREKMTALQASQ